MINSINSYNTTQYPRFGNRIINKPELFTEESLANVVFNYYNEGKIEEGSRLFLAGKSKLSKIFKMTLRKLSDNGFGVILQKADGSINLNDVKLFDPAKNAMLKLVNCIRNGHFYIIDF